MELAFLEDRLGEGERLPLEAAHRILYAVHGAVDVEARGSRASIHENSSWHGAAACVMHPRSAATVWRWDLLGRFRVETQDHTLVLAPGAPWFEHGPDPVYAEVIGDEPASFVRVMVLPVALRGKSSIRYVKPDDQARPKSQMHTVFVDAPITE